MGASIQTRHASLADLDAMVAHVQAGFDSYAEFAPQGWRVPSVERDGGSMADLLSDSETWALLALAELPEWWGRGVAPTLHDAAMAEMAKRGFDQARLYTPSSHARARRFYERRGWQALSEEWSDQLRLVLTEYRVPVLGRGSARER